MEWYRVATKAVVDFAFSLSFSLSLLSSPFRENSLSNDFFFPGDAWCFFFFFIKYFNFHFENLVDILIDMIVDYDSRKLLLLLFSERQINKAIINFYQVNNLLDLF